MNGLYSDHVFIYHIYHLVDMIIIMKVANVGFFFNIFRSHVKLSNCTLVLVVTVDTLLAVMNGVIVHRLL